MTTEIAACELDPDGLRRQRDRYLSLGRAAETIERRPGSLTVRFGPGLDDALLAEAIGVERSCCPFFAFDYSRSERLLRVTVAAPEQRAGLDAIADALGDPAHARRSAG